MNPFSPDATAMDKGTEALGAKKGTQSLHMHIEPSDNNRFIVRHSPHSDGSPTGQHPVHVLTDVKELLAHVKKHYTPQDNALDEAERKGKESAGGKEKGLEAATNE